MRNKWERKKRRLKRRAEKLSNKMGNAKKILPWIGTGFFGILAAAYSPSFVSIIFVLIAVLFAPISKWQEFIKGHLPQKWMKPVLLAALIVIAFIATPTQTEAETPLDTETAVATSTPVRASTSTEAPDIEPTETPEPTEEPVTPKPAEELLAIEPIENADGPQISATVQKNSDGTIKVPCASNACEGWHFEDVVKLYEDAGFTNIQAIPYEREIDPALTFDGCVVIVSIGEDAVFFEDASYSPDTQVNIGYVTAINADEAVIPENSSFEVHFIDVGQADAALVLCDNEAMLIDGGNRDDSSLIYSYLKNNGIEHLDYIVATHAHEDHVGGLPSALNYATVDTVYCPVAEYDSEFFSDFVKHLGKQNVSITVPTAGDSFKLGSATVDIIGPITESSDHNNMSIVLRIIYGETTFLFAGDANREEELDILTAGYILDSTVLKVGHHGSENGTTYQFLNEIMPEYAVISVGEENTYGHPTEATLSRLRDADVTVYRTDLQGDIVCTSDGETVTFSVEKNADADTLTRSTPVVTPAPTPTASPEPIADEEPDYVINRNSGKFHYPHCSSVDDMKASNRKEFWGTRDELVALGYSPCGRCHP